ncbi:MAG: SPOR domain-containing protein [Bacteroidales bacterium]|nr:SPOR domain-containing protein [Bacteroidales bacterium]
MLHKKLNALDNTIPGYRIQIYFESGNYSKSKAIEVKEDFESKYYGYHAYVSFNEPYYRVRIGDFRTKIEAVGFLKRIVRRYPNAFEVKDRITVSD